VTVQDLLRNYLSRVDVVFERFRKDQDMDLFLPIDTICVLERSRFHDGEARKGSLVRERRANQSVDSMWATNRGLFVLHVTLEKKSIVWLERPDGEELGFGNGWEDALLDYLRRALVVYPTI